MPDEPHAFPAQLGAEQVASLARLMVALDERGDRARIWLEQTDREAQMDARRDLESLDRTRAAALACATRTVRGLNQPRPSGPTAVVAHRQTWMLTRLSRELESCGVTVIGHASDGAAAVALACVELPDLLLVEAHLPWLTVKDVLALTRYTSERTALVVIADTTDDPDDLRSAGADLVLERSRELKDMCESVLSALRDPAA